MESVPLPLDYDEATDALGLSSATVWRFMPLEKALSLFTTRSMYFPSISLLQSEDPFEGHMGQRTISTYLELNRNADEINRIAEMYFGTNDRWKSIDDLKREILYHTDPHELRGYAAFHSRVWYANCWHINDSESAALWKLYSSYNSGIAIRSSILRLKDAFCDSARHIFVGRVSYAEDLQLADIRHPLPSELILTKRPSFIHENELRLYFMHLPDFEGSVSTDFVQQNPSGLAIICDPFLLTNEIILSPLCTDWAYDAISLTLKALGVEAPIRKSGLLDLPNYSNGA